FALLPRPPRPTLFPYTTLFRSLAGSQEQAGRAVAQHIDVIDLLALQLRHADRIDLRRRSLAALQQLAGVLATSVGAAKELAETSGLELHLAATLVALQARTFIALDAVLALFDLVTRAIRIVAAEDR